VGSDPEAREKHTRQDARQRQGGQERCGQDAGSRLRLQGPPHHQVQEQWAQVWERWWEIFADTQAGEGCGQLCAAMAQQEVLHMLLHQEGIGFGRYTQDDCQNLEQAWLPLAPGGQEEPAIEEAAAKKKGMGVALHWQKFSMVEAKHAPHF